jgi:hypothetical protein
LNWFIEEFNSLFGDLRFGNRQAKIDKINQARRGQTDKNKGLMFLVKIKPGESNSNFDEYVLFHFDLK